MFLNDIKKIVLNTESDLGLQAEQACENQRDDLVNSIGIIRSTKLEDILFEASGQDFHKRMAEVIYDFEENNKWPSLSALTFDVLTKTGVDLNSDDARIMLTAASLGEIQNTLPYHGNEHYRKVMMATIHQIAVHNDIYRDTGFELTSRDISLLVSAASIHDFMHDGKSNGEEPLRLEKMAFEKAKPFLRVAGADDNYLSDLKTIILCTDVNPMGSPNSPCNLMKAMYRYHFEEVENPLLPKDLKGLENKRLCLLAILFQEADMMPSLAFGSAQALREHMNVAKEAKFSGNPAAMTGFLEKVAGGYLTEAGKTNQAGYLVVLEAFKRDERKKAVYYEERHDFPPTPKFEMTPN